MVRLVANDYQLRVPMRKREYGAAGQALTVAGLGVASAATVATAAFGQTAVASNGTGKDQAVETVVVTSRRASLDVVPEKIISVPQSINVVPAEVIRQQGVNSLQDALRNVPGITLNAGEGGTHGDLVNLRGFPAGDDYFMDGLRSEERRVGKE